MSTSSHFSSIEAKLDRILGELEHLHNMEHRILDAIRAAEAHILSAIAALATDDTATKLSVNLGQPQDKP